MVKGQLLQFCLAAAEIADGEKVLDQAFQLTDQPAIDIGAVRRKEVQGARDEVENID